MVGRRSYQNTLALFRDVSERTTLEDIPLIATDGFEFYERVIGQVFGPACVYGQVIKTRRNNRIVKVERRAMIGAGWRFEERLQESEDSSKLNTSFIERLNLTIRQGSAYLCRRTICHARWKERLESHLELLRCYYNFVRPHRALKFGREVRTPAMQAGLTKKAADVPGDLLFGDGLFGIGRDCAPVRLFRYVLCRERGASSGLTTVDGGSTNRGLKWGMKAERFSARNADELAIRHGQGVPPGSRASYLADIACTATHFRVYRCFPG